VDRIENWLGLHGEGGEHAYVVGTCEWARGEGSKRLGVRTHYRAKYQNYIYYSVLYICVESFVLKKEMQVVGCAHKSSSESPLPTTMPAYVSNLMLALISCVSGKCG
jgi:hypothetical protein